MKQTTSKKQLLDYDRLYATLLSIICFCLLYVGINFFLLSSNVLTFSLLTIGFFSFISALLTKARLFLYLSLTSTFIGILLSLILIYL